MLLIHRYHPSTNEGKSQLRQTENEFWHVVVVVVAGAGAAAGP